MTEIKHRRKHVSPGIVVLVLESGAEGQNRVDMGYVPVDSDETSSFFLEVNKSLSRTIILKSLTLK